MKITKIALIVLISASVSQMAHAAFKTNDLYLGLTESSAQNDYIIDLGQPSVIGVGGSTPVTLSSDFSLGTFNSVFSGGADGVNLAVVGGNNTFNHYEIYATQMRVGGAGNPAVAGSSMSGVTNSSPRLSGGAATITGVASSVGGLPAAGGSILDSSKSYSAQIDLTDSANSFVGKSGINPAGTMDATGIIYLDLYHATLTSNYTYLGYFTLNVSSALLTFTPSAAPNTSGPPVPALTIARSGTNNLISFLSANSATYTLYYTNSTGLKASMSTWATAGSLSGDGTSKTFTNSSPDANRFYGVGGH
jgi:hypothetical protein